MTRFRIAELGKPHFTLLEKCLIRVHRLSIKSAGCCNQQKIAASGAFDSVEGCRARTIASAMPLLDRIQKDMVEAMKAKDEARLSTVRLIKTALKKHEIDSMKPLDEATENQVMNTLLKQRRESADMFRKGGREELAAKEEAEIVLIEAYLPSAPSAAELEQAVSAAIAETGANSAKQMGLVMKAAQAKLAGKRVDGKALSELVKSRLQ